MSSLSEAYLVIQVKACDCLLAKASCRAQIVSDLHLDSLLPSALIYTDRWFLLPHDASSIFHGITVCSHRGNV